MALVVGEAEILIKANTAALDAQVASLSESGALSNLGTKAEKVGNDIGSGLSTGVDNATKDLGKGAEKELENSTGRMSSVINDFSSKAKSSLAGFGIPPALLNGPAVATVAFGAIAAGALDLGSKMQRADAQIAALSGTSVKSATAIGNAFLTTGGQQEHSAIQMAQAYAQVAGQLKITEGRALSTKEALDFMSTANDLATATSTDLGMTTATLAKLMQAYQIPVADAAKASNVLFNASNATGQSLDSLATSMEKIRAKLGGAAPPMADLAALTVDFTKQGITGRAAVSGLNIAVTALGAAASGTTTAGIKAAKLLEDYGVSAKTATGQITPMSTIIEKLGPKFATMSQSQQIATASLIFGAGAAKQMTAVIDAGTAAYDKASGAVNKHNAVTIAAQLQEKTLSGQMKILKNDVIDLGTKLGLVLVPAFTTVAHATLDVVNDIITFGTWMSKGSIPALAIAGVLTAVVAPAFIKMGVEAVQSSYKVVAGFITDGFAATKSAATTVASMLTSRVSVKGFGTTVVATGAEVEATLGEEQLAFEGFGTTVLATDTAIEGANVAAGESFTAMLGPIGAVAAAGVAAYLITTKLLDKLKEMVTVKPTAQLGARSKEALARAGLSSDSPQVQSGLLTGKQLDYMTKTHQEQVAKEIAASNRALNIPSATDAYIPIASGAAAKTKSATSAAASKAHAAASKAAAAVLKDENLLSSEIVKAVTMPANEAATYLSALGVPTAKATTLLHDSMLPLRTAIKAIEDLGLPAQDAVKIAEAGQAQLKKIAATAAAAAKKAKANSAKSAALDAFADLDAALARELDLNQGKYGQSARSGGKNVMEHLSSRDIHIHQGAVTVTIGNGHNADSIHKVMTDAVNKLADNLKSGTSQLGVHHG